MAIPAGAYYGIQTQRALDNFRISGIGINHYPNLISAFGMVKRACATANRKLGYLEAEKYRGIAQACDELIAGKLHEWFTVDVFQGGAGTSTNMNVNEVVANRALELLSISICTPTTTSTCRSRPMTSIRPPCDWVSY
jgi:aspartate ammonia-lyase